MDLCGPKKCEADITFSPPSPPPSVASPPQDGLCIPGDDATTLIKNSNTVTATVTSSGVVGTCEIDGDIKSGCQRFCYLIEQMENGNGPSSLFSIGFDVRLARGIRRDTERELGL